MIYSFDDVRAVHLELTDRCNAACPMCPRYNLDGTLSPHVKDTQLYLSDIHEIMPPAFVQQIDRVNFCGNYGDPIVARDLLDIIHYFILYNPTMRIEVNTNGSARTPQWWEQLALLTGPNEEQGGVWFGLDGLEDTNHLYRRNTRWDIIMRNAEAFIAKGGVAHWNFIVFEHNEHQVEEARRLAREMGFKHFNVKLTGRFKESQTFPVMSRGEHLYDLKPAEAERYDRPVLPSKVSTAGRSMDEVIDHLRRKGYLDGKIQTPIEVAPPNIQCIAAEEKCIYLSARGHVFPCCWIGDAQNCDSEVNLDLDRLDARKHSIKEIVEGPDFQVVEDSWATGSISKCVRFCGVNETDDKLKHGPDYVLHERVDG